MTNGCDVFRNCGIIIRLSSLKILFPYTNACGFMDLQMSKMICVNYAYVTGFGKTCIVHTSNFSNLAINKISSE